MNPMTADDIPYPFITYIKWVDSFGCSSSWGALEIDKCKPMHCESVGYVVFEDSEIVVIAPHRTLPHPGREGVDYCGDMTIPKVAIVDKRIWNGQVEEHSTELLI